MFNLSIDLQLGALNSGPHYNFKTALGPNGTKHWNDGQLSFENIIIEIHNDGLYEKYYEEYKYYQKLMYF